MKAKVAPYTVKYDPSFWNIDSLSLRGTLDGLGSTKTVFTHPEDRRDVIAASMTDLGNIVALRPRRVELIDVAGTLVDSYECKNDEVYIDIANAADSVLLLNYATQSVDSFREILTDNATVRTGGKKSELKKSSSWAVLDHKIERGTRLSVSKSKNEVLIVCFYSVEDGSIALGRPSNWPTELEMKRITLHLPDAGPRLGTEVHACIDNRKETIIVADTLNHRILEADYRTFHATHLCGIDGPGTCETEGEICTKAPLRYPRGVALYRCRDVVLEDYFSDDAKSFILADATGVLPRTIIIADSANLQLKRIVDLPGSIDGPKLFTLLGSGKKPSGWFQGARRFEIPNSDFGTDDLRKMNFHDPRALTVSAQGEVLVRTGSQDYLYLLQPATSVPRRTITEKLQRAGPGT